MIEDNASDAALIRLAFDALEACTAFVCRNLSEAKAYLHGAGMYADRVQHPFPNAVICDLNLGGESGLEFVVWLEKSNDFKKMPVVILTGSTSERDISAVQNRSVIAILKIQPNSRIYDQCSRIQPANFAPKSDDQKPRLTFR